MEHADEEGDDDTQMDEDVLDFALENPTVDEERDHEFDEFHILNVRRDVRADELDLMQQVVETEDEHATVHPSVKTTGQTQSSFVSSGFTSKMLNIEDVSPNLESVFELPT